MSHPRIVVRGATTALTRRTTFRKAFLGDWHPLVSEIWLYALADAQRHTGVAVHHTVRVVSHHHTSVTPATNNLPEFLRRVHLDMSRALNTLLAHERYDAPHELFDDRPTHCMRLLDAAAQASHLVYEHLNPVAAGLVARPELMPGRVITFRDYKRGYITVRKPLVFFGDGRPEELKLYLTPPPLLYRAFDGDIDALVYHLDKLVQHGIREVRQHQRRAPLGAKAVQHIHPWSEPSTLRETGGKLVASYKIGARGILGDELDTLARAETTRFRYDHQQTRRARRDGDLEPRYPFGTYQAPVLRGEPVEREPLPDAFLTRPGPTLDEVEDDLERHRPENHDERRSIVAMVEAALTEEAEDIVDHDEVELTDQHRDHAQPAPSADIDARPAAIVVRRRSKPKTKRRSAAKRIVVLRDRRRGRPTKSDGRHGADPPG